MKILKQRKKRKKYPFWALDHRPLCFGGFFSFKKLSKKKGDNHVEKSKSKGKCWAQSNKTKLAKSQ